VLSYLGLISFGIYLYHFAVVKQLDDWVTFPGPAELRFVEHAVVAMIGATAIASLSYYVVERPALRLKRLVRRRFRVERGEATAEPINPSSATPASTASATSAGWRKRGTPSRRASPPRPARTARAAASAARRGGAAGRVRRREREEGEPDDRAGQLESFRAPSACSACRTG